MTNKIKESNITDGAVTSDKIAPGTIANDRLAGSIAISKLATDPTNASNISSGTLANARLTGSGAITINGTSIALGASGDITAGTDWQSVKTANYTAVAGQGIFANTTGGAFTITLPASPTIGDEVHIVDYAGTFNSNNITVARNGSKIDSTAADAVLNVDRLSVRFVFIDATQGWRAIFDDTSTTYGLTHMAATGGTETTTGNFKIHTFNSSGNFVVSAIGSGGGSTTVDYLIVAGGGGGGGGDPHDGGGGGGAGGARMSSGAASGCYSASPLGSGVSALPVSAQTYPVTVGGGGALGSPKEGSKGSDSTFSTITSAGGGAGDGFNNPASTDTSGGSGGGSHQEGVGSGKFTGNTPPVSPPQGQNGGGVAAYPTASGGGGAGAEGGVATATAGSEGGSGILNSITGSSVGYAGGGAGGGSPARGYPDVASAANGGHPFGGGSSGSAPRPGSANKGGGGGGGSDNAAGNGGSGVVILRYQYQ